MSNSSGRRVLTDGRDNSNTHVLEAAPTPQNFSLVFSEESVEANESSHIKLYYTAWRHSKSIQQSILSRGESKEYRSHALTISLRHNSLKDIFSLAGDIIPKDYATVVHH